MFNVIRVGHLPERDNHCYQWADLNPSSTVLQYHCVGRHKAAVYLPILEQVECKENPKPPMNDHAITSNAVFHSAANLNTGQ